MPANFDLEKYLTRTGLSAPLASTLQDLAALQSAHAEAIPFEGIDRLMRLPVSIDLQSLQAKIVDGLRGGNCFEQNLLFMAALEEIGFDVRGLGARVRWMSPPDSPMGPREHMLLLVELADGPWIADVGFGACVLDEPLKLAPGLEQRTSMGTFRLDLENGLYFLNARQPGGWRCMYAFGLERQFLSDYVMANAYAPLNPMLPFLSNLVAERVTPGRRFKLINRKWLVEARDGEIIEEHAIASAQDLGQVLETQFRIRASVDIEEMYSRTPA